MSSASGALPRRPQDVPRRTLAELARYLAPHLARDAPAAADAVVTGLALDSRAVVPGDVYAAVAGARAHGAQFAADARLAGAVAALTDLEGAVSVRDAGLPAYVVDRPREVLGPLASWIYGNPSGDLRVVGVTGTNGKTTVSYLVEAGLRAAGCVTGLIGTIETHVAGERAASVRTTPEAPDLQAMLAVMREQGVEAVAMEVSSHALALRRVDGTAYDIAVFTNLTPDHLDFHRDLQDYFAAKARLFTPELAKRAVVNVDDAYGARLQEQAAIPLVTVSPAGIRGAAWQVHNRAEGPRESRFALTGPAGVTVSAATRLPGAFNVDNVALAVVALAELGVDPALAAEGVASLEEVPGRMQVIDAGQDFVALVDFAHTPDALQRLLVSARELTAGRLIVVFGCGGDRDAHKRPIMGEIAARTADLAILTSDNPRTENAMDILAAVHAGAAGVAGGADLEVIADRAGAIARAVECARAGDLVVVAGKGHEKGQEVDGVVHPFDDADVLRAAIRRLGRASAP